MSLQFIDVHGIAMGSQHHVFHHHLHLLKAPEVGDEDYIEQRGWLGQGAEPVEERFGMDQGEKTSTLRGYRGKQVERKKYTGRSRLKKNSKAI